MLVYSVTILHVLVCFILVLVVLLQSGKGADLAGAFGGGSTQTAFGSRGPASFLSKMTTIAAIVFMLTSIGLSLISTNRASRSVLEGAVEESVLPEADETGGEAADETVLTPEQIDRKIEELRAKEQQQTDTGDSAPASDAPPNPGRPDPAP